MRAKWVAASVAISSMWVATLFIAIFAPELKSYSAGGDVTTLPLAGIIAAGVAFIATIVVAAVGFGPGRGRDPELDREQFEREKLEARIRELEGRMPTDEQVPEARLRPLLHH
jgi:hypothetical protein